MEFTFNKREFYKSFMKLTIPIATQNLIASTLNLVDTVMIGRLGETEIASVGLANQIFFLLNLFLFGVYSGSAIFTAQFWGKKDIGGIRKALGLSLGMGIAAAFLFFLTGFLFPKQVLSIFSKDPEVIILGSSYLRIASLSYMPMAVTFAYSFVLRSTEQVKLPMFTSMVALGLNTILNYTLIFGHFGFTPMGVRGAAIATVIARGLEVCIILTVVYVKKLTPAASMRELLGFSREFVHRFVKTTIPVIGNETFWALGVTVYAVVYGRMGTGVIAAVNIASTVERIAFVFFLGMANACAAMVGKQIGAGDEKKAYAYARKFATLGPALGVLAGSLVILSSRYVLMVYKISDDVYASAVRILFIMGILLFVKVFNMINIVGIMRSGGDTTFSLIIEITGIWLIAVPIALLGGLYWKLPVEWVIILISIEEVYKAVIGIARFLSKKWINNLVKQFDN